MANRYGEAALMAARMKATGAAVTPEQCWQNAVEKLYPTSRSAQRKGCPKSTFLVLCEAGLIRGVPSGQYTASTKNKTYALEAVDLLRAGTHRTVTQLWGAVSQGELAHNSQMDVVVALWRNGLIVE